MNNEQCAVATAGGRVENEIRLLIDDQYHLGIILESILNILVGERKDDCVGVEGGPKIPTLEEILHEISCRMGKQKVMAEDIRKVLDEQLGQIKLSDRSKIQRCANQKA